MLKFLFKRPGDKSAESPAVSAQSEQKAAAAAATASTTAQRTAQAARLRELGQEEALAADFILQCDFSELRLAAANLIRSRPQLERVHAAIRNTDRRVAKLLQGRLDAIRHYDAEVARGQACLEQARALLADDKLTPNQVAELDRRWAVIAAPELKAAFDNVREQLGRRLEAQVALQRAMIDRLAGLRRLSSGADAQADLEARFAQMRAEQQAAVDGAEQASLPRQLVAEFAAEQARVQASLATIEQGRNALAARQAALDGWAAALAGNAAAAKAVTKTVTDTVTDAVTDAVTDTVTDAVTNTVTNTVAGTATTAAAAPSALDPPTPPGDSPPASGSAAAPRAAASEASLLIEAEPDDPGVRGDQPQSGPTALADEANVSHQAVPAALDAASAKVLESASAADGAAASDGAIGDSAATASDDGAATAGAVATAAAQAPAGAIETAGTADTADIAAPEKPAAPIAPPLSAEQLKREWQRLPAPPAGDAADALQQRFDAMLAALAPAKSRTGQAKVQKARGDGDGGGAQSPAATASPASGGAGAQGRPARQLRPVGGADPLFLDHLAAMESALEQGSLHSAAEYDKALKDLKGGKLSGAQADRLAHARAELKHLSDWARWGGNVSREELIKAVEQLGAQSLPMAELAKKVGSMRERWKALDTLSGAAPKTLWERFDSACTSAYAPAAAHFKHLAEERHTNATRAQALIDEAVAQAAKIEQAAAAGAATGAAANTNANGNANTNTNDAHSAGDADIDWKLMAATVQRLRLGWSHLGAIDRKDKKRLDQQFAAALNIMQRPLERQRKAEVGHREALIEQVAGLDPAERGALDALRGAQERWQELARALPLERKAEQAMWHRFRAACDAVFAKRKESANAADSERRAHQAAKEAISKSLEDAAARIDAAGARKLLLEAASQWQAVGAVPRAVEAKVEQRYQAAVAAMQAKIDDEKRAAGIARASALRDKLRLCQQLEAALIGDSAGESSGESAGKSAGESAGESAGKSAGEADWQSRWDALPALAPEFDKPLSGRFQAALAALEGRADRAAYLRKLEQNRPVLLQEVLRQEIAAGIDSGSDFARERLKLQVEVLQSSLKSGQKNTGQAAQLASIGQLAALPALVDERTARRIEQLFARVGKAAR